MAEGEKTGIELLLSEPEIVAWLEAAETSDLEPLEGALELSATEG